MSESKIGFEVTVIERRGKCVMDYETGDTFVFTGLNTPEKRFCGASFHAMFPGMLALRFGAEFPFAQESGTLTVTCPDHGYVTFKLRRIEV